MLVLTRKVGEQIRIGDEVVITVVRTKGKAVRLGIQAPSHVPVLRGEIADAISGEQQRRAADGGQFDDSTWPSDAAGDGPSPPSSPSATSSCRTESATASPLRRLVMARSV
ncbi:MAG: carbon storage regulator CsrA [Pirellulales bacterium]|nr:carbon storage regulator CsrA [Pirellulales bacterium]